MDSSLFLRPFLALLFVSSLIILIALIVKKLGLYYPSVGQHGAKRLAILEVTMIDPKRRLVLIKRDNVEHLLLLGTTSEMLIETIPPQQAEESL